MLRSDGVRSISGVYIHFVFFLREIPFSLLSLVLYPEYSGMLDLVVMAWKNSKSSSWLTFLIVTCSFNISVEKTPGLTSGLAFLVSLVQCSDE